MALPGLEPAARYIDDQPVVIGLLLRRDGWRGWERVRGYRDPADGRGPCERKPGGNRGHIVRRYDWNRSTLSCGEICLDAGCLFCKCYSYWSGGQWGLAPLMFQQAAVVGLIWVTLTLCFFIPGLLGNQLFLFHNQIYSAAPHSFSSSSSSSSSYFHN